MKKLFKENRIFILTVAAILTAAVITAVFFTREVNQWPLFRSIHLETLAKTIGESQIYWHEDDDPLLYTYQTWFETDEAPSTAEIRKAFRDVIRADGDKYYELANIMLSYYDKYSKLVSPETYGQMYPENENYGGLGMMISAYGPFIRVSEVYADSAAGRAGILPGDLIACVNGQDIRPLPYEEASELLASVSSDGGSIAVLRDGEDALLSFDLIPGEVVIPNVEWKTEGDTAYLNVTLFAGETFNDLVDSAFAAFREADARRLILDLRNNRGGTISLLIHLLDALTPEKDVLMFTEAKRDKTIEHYSKGVGMSFDEIVVLADQNTCSSAEVCTGYMKDRGYPVIGTLTYGKGTGLSIIDFFGDVLVLATIDILLPVTGHYNEIGIIPTEEVTQMPILYELPQMQPLPTDTAIDADSREQEILALEQRLYVLGYLTETPDGSWDEATTAAVSAVGTAQERTTADSALLTALQDMTERLSKAFYYADTQLEAAYRMLDLPLEAAA